MRRPGPAGTGAVVPIAILAMLAAGCADGQPSGPAQTQAVNAPSTQVELDTPELRAVRREAGLEPCRNGPGQVGEAVERGLPSLELPCFGAPGSVDLATLRGPMVVNVWASWCAPCRSELPILQEFAERHAGRVAVLGVDYADRQTTNAGDLLLETGVTYPQVADPGGALSGADPLPRIAGLPFLALVDADGRIVHQEFRELGDRADLERLVEEHLGVGL